MPGIARARPRCRCCISGKSGSRTSKRCCATFWAANLPGAEDAPRERPHVCRAAGPSRRSPTSSKIDPIIGETAEHWRLSRMAALDRLILRLAIGEFLDGATPRNVVINEALELAKTFSGDESAKFVNGILDAVKKKLP